MIYHNTFLTKLQLPRPFFFFFFFFNDPPPPEIYPLSLHDALPILPLPRGRARHRTGRASRSSAWRVWQLTHSSVARVAVSGTRVRLVEPQLVQIHSAVAGIVIHG